MGIKLRNQSGSVSILVVLMFMAIVIAAFMSSKTTDITRTKAQQGSQLALDMGFLDNEVSVFLSSNSNCQKNFLGAGYAAAHVTRDRLRRLDDSVIYATNAVDPGASYLAGKAKFIEFQIDGFVPNFAGSKKGRARFIAVKEAQINQTNGQGMVYTSSVEMFVELNGSDEIIDCRVNLYEEGLWSQDANGIYRPTGRVGIQTAAPTDNLTVLRRFIPTMGGGRSQDIATFGSTVNGGIAFRVNDGGPSFAVGGNLGDNIVVKSTLANDGFVINSTAVRAGINYPDNTNLAGHTHLLQIKSTDGTPQLAIRGTPAAGSPKWNMTLNSAVDNHLRIEPAGAMNPVFRFKNPITPVGAVADLRIGSENDRSATDVNFYSHGVAGGTSAWVTTSDRKFKEKIRPLHDVLKQLSQINGYYYTWKDHPERGEDIGLIAQEVQKTAQAKYLVQDKGPKLSLQYAPMTALLVEGVKELDRRQNKLEDKIEKMQRKLQEGTHR